ncbi:hypothetical protein PGT21_012019 [Puccinia graminis f. sp. tritici]|uniref:Uncharacterized protein n=1 Tax=Puccinia graminis f. sp. tritici TaxID=56615 RepID=A0A5B0LR79_PUCGR|nr:hypothetical protein PGTUg99_017738 [Puccinia graminis f. sp. tritici]KAA1083939.1 hypothetical protein PGT21_012019 [Puccinia graminis f. sp. tritici]
MHFSILLLFLAVSLIHQGQAESSAPDEKPYPVRNCEEEDRFILLCARPVKPEDNLKTAEGLMVEKAPLIPGHERRLCNILPISGSMATRGYCCPLNPYGRPDNAGAKPEFQFKLEKDCKRVRVNWPKMASKI